jgi:hypothetical protein
MVLILNLLKVSPIIINIGILREFLLKIGQVSSLKNTFLFSSFYI